MGHRILLLSLLVLASVYTLAATQIQLDPWSAAETVNSQTLPMIYGSLLCVALLVMLVRSLQLKTVTEIVSLQRVGTLVGISALIVSFVFLLALVNLWLALGALLFATGWWLGERRYLLLLGIALAVPLVGWLAIEVMLGVYLPG